MSSIFRVTTASDLGEILRLFREAFHPDDDAQLLDRELAHWKYWEPRPDFVGARSFALEKDGRLVAHGAVWPFEIMARSGNVRGIHLIDWAADASAAGAGITLLRRLVTQEGFVCSFGGSGDTRAILPKLGFKTLGEFRTYARPLRPFRQLVTHQYRNYKLPARLARNLAWRILPRLSWPTGWSVTAVQPREISSTLLPANADAHVSCTRSVGMFEYVSACPAVPFSWYSIARSGTPCGYFCLSVAHGQARVADVWMQQQTVEHYTAAHTLAALTALRDTSAVEIVATSCWPIASRALAVSGYRLFGTAPVMASGPTVAGLDGAAPDFQMIDCDFAFLHEGRASYIT